MYTGFNMKKARKLSRIEVLEAEVKKLHKLLGTMMHLHERLKNERTQIGEVTELPTLPQGTHVDSKAIESTSAIMQNITDRKTKSRKVDEGV